MRIQQSGNTSRYESLGWWPFAADPAPWNSPCAVPSTGPSIPAPSSGTQAVVSRVPLGTQSTKAPLSSLCWVLGSLVAAPPSLTDARTLHPSAPPFVPEDTGSPHNCPVYLQGALPPRWLSCCGVWPVGLMGPLCPVSLPHTAGAFLNTAC